MATDERKQERERGKTLKAEYSKLLTGSPVDPRIDGASPGPTSTELAVYLQRLQAYRESALAQERMKAVGFGHAGGSMGPSIHYEPSVPQWKYNEVKGAMAALAAELLEALPELLLARESKLHDAYKRVMRIMEADAQPQPDMGQVQQAAAIAMNKMAKQMASMPISITKGSSTSEANAGTV